MEAFVAAGAGFLLAVLWFDLMHDELARGHRGDVLPETVIDGVSRYYAQVTQGASPMNRLVAVAMLGTLAAIVVEIVRDFDPAWIPVASLAAALVAIGVAIARTVPTAVRIGQREVDDVAVSAMIRVVRRDHHLAFVCMAGVLVLQLVAAAS